jgi:hypothetical protein
MSHKDYVFRGSHSDKPLSISMKFIPVLNNWRQSLSHVHTHIYLGKNSERIQMTALTIIRANITTLVSHNYIATPDGWLGGPDVT